jgi:hypothetical protein
VSDFPGYYLYHRQSAALPAFTALNAALCYKFQRWLTIFQNLNSAAQL